MSETPLYHLMLIKVVEYLHKFQSSNSYLFATGLRCETHLIPVRIGATADGKYNRHFLVIEPP